MARQHVEAYIRHIDHYGVEGVAEVVERDRDLSDEDREAIKAYLATIPRKKK